MTSAAESMLREVTAGIEFKLRVMSEHQVRLVFCTYCALRFLREKEREHPEACRALMVLMWRAIRGCVERVGEAKIRLSESVAVLAHDHYWGCECNLQEAQRVMAEKLLALNCRREDFEQAYEPAHGAMLAMFTDEGREEGKTDDTKEEP